MDEIPEDALRISDADRETATTALGEHMSAGRLDLDEYGERAAKVTAAKTRAELLAVFRDLPTPHPQFAVAPLGGRPHGGAPRTSPTEDDQNRGEATPAPERGNAVAHGIWGSAMTVIVAAVVLFLVTHQWWWFLMIPLATMLVGRGGGHRHHGRPHRERYRSRERY